MRGIANEAAFETVARNAIECRECFTRGEVSAPFINVAQPRWVGPRYWNYPWRVLILMLNPGQSRPDAGAKTFLKLIRQYREGTMELRSILEGQRESMRRWGNPPGRFTRFYIEGLGLTFDEIAFANVAWCGTAGNVYPRTMLARCFARHTGPLLQILRPDVVIASGRPAHAFAGQICELLPTTRVIKALHYAHREGRAVEPARRRRAAATPARARPRPRCTHPSSPWAAPRTTGAVSGGQSRGRAPGRRRRLTPRQRRRPRRGSG